MRCVIQRHSLSLVFRIFQHQVTLCVVRLVLLRLVVTIMLALLLQMEMDTVYPQ